MAIKILIVEDDTTSAKLMEITLRRMNYEITGLASNGKQAIELSAQVPPDIILMDINMPGEIDGIEAARRIKKEQRIPVLYVTANNEESIVQRAIKSDPIGYILKPFSREYLRTMIEMGVYRHTMENKLRESKQLLSVTLQSIGDGVISTDKEGKINFVNKVAAVLLGIEDPMSCHGIPLSNVYPIREDHSEKVIPLTINYIRENKSLFNADFVLIPEPDIKIPISQSISEIEDPEAGFQGLIITFRDITQRKETERAMQVINQELENKVEIRTLELREKNALLETEIKTRKTYESELQLAIQKEKKINEFKSNVVTTISHEFRTPMTTIRSSAELIKRNLEKNQPIEKVIKHLDLINRSIDNVLELLNDVLLIEKIDSKHADINIQPINPSKFFIELTEDIKVGIGRNHYFDYQHNIFPLEIETDAKLLRQIATNMLSNAFKYSGLESSVLLLVYIDFEIIKITVKDQGIGIPEENLHHLFEPFYRGNNVSNMEGTGIGLSILRKSVNLLGGTIDVDSKPGYGTKFTVTLPRRIQKTTE
jgi:PAS domain S-box-containing protein